MTPFKWLLANNIRVDTSRAKEGSQSQLHKFSEETKAEVLRANDIVDVIGSFLELKSSGSGRSVGLCPFHKEKTPSFSVSRDRQMFYCFGCQKGGDAITFLREYEGLTFMEALQKLADRGAVRLPALSERDNSDDYKRAKLIEFGKFAQKLFKQALSKQGMGERASAYLDSRQLSKETIEEFALGYAPESWSFLIDAALKAGFKNEIIEASGLAKRGSKGGLYDFFRDRLMVPIRDVSGNVVAFGGRDLSGESPAKYINSPENVIYKKGRVLYGLYQARDSMRREKSVILVEGYFDLLRCFDSGIKNVVATCGTALTKEQAALMRRYVSEVVLVFDGDPAGVRAAVRGVTILMKAGLAVKAIVLPKNQDPDDYVRDSGKDAFKALIEDAADFFSFYTKVNEARLKTIEGRTEVIREVYALIVEIDDRLRQEQYIRRVAPEIGVDHWVAWSQFQKFVNEHHRKKDTESSPASTDNIDSEPKPSKDDISFIAALLNSAELLERAKLEVADVELPAGALKDVLGLIIESSGQLSPEKLQDRTAKALYAAAANVEYDPKTSELEPFVTKRTASLKRDALAAQARSIQEQIKQAERSNNRPLLLDLVSKKTGIEREIQKVGAT